MRSADRNHIAEQLELNKQDMRKSWKIIKSIIGKDNNNKKSSMDMNFIVNGQLSNCPLAITNAFNNYFIEIGPKLASELTPLADPMSYITYIPNSIFIPDVTYRDPSGVYY